MWILLDLMFLRQMWRSTISRISKVVMLVILNSRMYEQGCGNCFSRSAITCLHNFWLESNPYFMCVSVSFMTISDSDCVVRAPSPCMVSKLCRQVACVDTVTHVCIHTWILNMCTFLPRLVYWWLVIHYMKGL